MTLALNAQIARASNDSNGWLMASTRTSRKANAITIRPAHPATHSERDLCSSAASGRSTSACRTQLGTLSALFLDHRRDIAGRQTQVFKKLKIPITLAVKR